MPKRAKYDVVEEDKPFRVYLGKNALKLACCSCGLVHMFNFEVDENFLEITIRRKNRETAMLRQHRSGELFKGENGYKLKKV
jgi:hypothetical protein